ncbi:MAG TPA: hypothetical protein VH724_18885 [Candidatus Angelobacter sp.]|nr:hypothetical protein [Candidatus Angelobacter sp.]
MLFSVALFGGEYEVASLDSLIRLKKAAGRKKDLNALPELEAERDAWRQPPKAAA